MSAEQHADVRARIASARRIVVKVGSSSLTSRTHGLDPQRLAQLADAIAHRADRGTHVVLVSSGAIASGLAPLGLTQRPADLALQQAAASVGQGLLVAQWTSAFARHGRTVGQVLLTSEDVVRRSHYRNAQRTLDRLLDLGIVPVVNENDTVATDEIRFGDNDRLAALVAHVVRAEALILLSDVDGLYTAEPGTPDAQLIDSVASDADLAQVTLGGTGSAGVGLGGMRTKVEAARIATRAGIPVLLTSAAQADDAVGAARSGTVFVPGATPVRSRLLWLAYASEPQGRLHLDPGAVAAVVERRLSLLPAGVTAVEGDFVAGDPVDVVDPAGQIVARGLVAYDASDVPVMLGRSTRDLVAEFGSGYERELIHRDDMVLLDAAGSMSASEETA